MNITAVQFILALAGCGTIVGVISRIIHLNVSSAKLEKAHSMWFQKRYEAKQKRFAAARAEVKKLAAAPLSERLKITKSHGKYRVEELICNEGHCSDFGLSYLYSKPSAKWEPICLYEEPVIHNTRPQAQRVMDEMIMKDGPWEDCEPERKGGK